MSASATKARVNPLRQLRESRGLTVRQLAELSGVSDSQIRHIQ